jgi:hypothetical protein
LDLAVRRRAFSRALRVHEGLSVTALREHLDKHTDTTEKKLEQ